MAGGALIKNLDDWLYHWAAWCRRYEDHGLGYPNRTQEYELHRMGGVLIRGEGGPKPIPMDQDAKDADDALQGLRRAKENHWFVIRAHYYEEGGLTNRAKAGIASRLMGRPITDKTYKRILEEARMWLDAWRAGRGSQ